MKTLVAILCILLSLFVSSCNNNEVVKESRMTHAGNIQNGGYAIMVDGYYFYANIDDNNNLYRSSIDGSKKEKLSSGHYFYEMNLYNGEIYYVSGSPGEIWKLSVSDLTKKRLIDQKVGNLILYNGYMYYRLSEENDWGNLYCADLDGKNKKKLAERVSSFCVHNDLIYYFDINNNALCSMNIDGTENEIINCSYVNNIFVQNDSLIYSDHNRNDKLFSYDLSNRIEKCISEDRCWDINGSKEWIFYRNQSDDGNLYCVSFDGSDKCKLANGNVFDILVIGDVIFYKNINVPNKIEYIYFRDAKCANGDVQCANGDVCKWGRVQMGTCLILHVPSHLQQT